MGVRSAQRIDVRRLLQHRCDNSLRNNFHIGIEENLDQLFGCRMAPWEGCELRINFEINSFVVNLNLPVVDMKLACEVRLGYLTRPIMSPSPVDSSSARRQLLGIGRKDELEKEKYGRGSGRTPASRWVPTFDQPKRKSTEPSKYSYSKK